MARLVSREFRDDPKMPRITASSAEEFLRLLRAILMWSGRTAGQVAERGGLSRSTAYNFVSPKNTALPQNPRAVMAFCDGCGLPEEQLGAVIEVWRKLREIPAAPTPSYPVVEAELVETAAAPDVRLPIRYVPVQTPQQPPQVTPSPAADTNHVVNVHGGTGDIGLTINNFYTSDIDAESGPDHGPRGWASVRVDRQDYESLRYLARSSGISPGDLMGRLIRYELHRHILRNERNNRDTSFDRRVGGGPRSGRANPGAPSGERI